MYQLELSCRSQVDAMAARTELTMPGENVLAHTAHLYQPGARRPYGVLEWPAMLRLLAADREELGLSAVLALSASRAATVRYRHHPQRGGEYRRLPRQRRVLRRADRGRLRQQRRHRRHCQSEGRPRRISRMARLWAAEELCAVARRPATGCCRSMPTSGRRQNLPARSRRCLRTPAPMAGSCRAVPVFAAASCGIRAGRPITCCACSAAAKRGSTTPWSMSA